MTSKHLKSIRVCKHVDPKWCAIYKRQNRLLTLGEFALKTNNNINLIGCNITELLKLCSQHAYEISDGSKKYNRLSEKILLKQLEQYYSVSDREPQLISSISEQDLEKHSVNHKLIFCTLYLLCDTAESKAMHSLIS